MDLKVTSIRDVSPEASGFSGEETSRPSQAAESEFIETAGQILDNWCVKDGLWINIHFKFIFDLPDESEDRERFAAEFQEVIACAHRLDI